MRRRTVVVATVVVATFVATVVGTAFVPAGRSAAAEPAVTLSSVDTSMVLVGEATGTILDVSPNRMLFKDWSDQEALKVKDRDGAAVVTLPRPPDTHPGQGWLTPTGALVSAVDNDGSHRLYAWSGGDALIELGLLGREDSVTVRGSYAIWNDAATLYRRDLSAGQTVVVATDAGSFRNDLAGNGDVYYWTSPGPSQIMRYHDGNTQQLTEDAGDNAYPVTDGVNVAYTRRADQGSVWLYDGLAHLPITRQSGAAPIPGVSYQVVAGWMAFLRTDGAGRDQVWSRSPAGALSQLSTGDEQPSYVDIVDVSPTGQTVYAMDDRLYLGVSGQPPILLASGYNNWYPRQIAAGQNFATFVADRWHLVIGYSLYVQSDQPPVTLSVGVDGNGGVSIAPYGMVCRVACEVSLPVRATLTLTATADQPGWLFDGWSGSCAGTEPTCAVWLGDAATVRAVFVPGDVTAPQTTVPVVSVPAGERLSARFPAEIPVAIAWSAADPDDRVARDELEVSVGDGRFGPVALDSVAAQQARLVTLPTNSYQLRVRATDPSGNAGEWIYGAPFTVDALPPEAADYTGAWSTQDSPAAWFATTWSTTQPSASATVSAGGQSLGIVGSTGPGFADLDVFVDEELVQTVHTAAGSSATRQILAAVNLDGGYRTVRVAHAGGTGPVVVEGFVVLH